MEKNYRQEARVNEAEVCASCRFWSEANHLCRRYAPMPMVDAAEKGGRELHARWTATDGDDWCGEYEPILMEEEYEEQEEEVEEDEWAEDGSPAW